MISLKNQWLRLDLDEQARITWLEDINSGNGNVIAEPKQVFRTAILRTQDALGMGENKEDMAFADEQDITVEKDGETAVVTVRNLKTKMGEKEAQIRLTIKLDGPEVVFGGEVENNSDSCIDELYYPCVGSMDSIGKGAPDLLFPIQSGERIKDICSLLKTKKNREELHEISDTYPGFLSMGWMMLTDNVNCLYMACYDELFHTMTMRAKGSEQGGVTLEFDKMCFVEKGETWQIPKMVIRLYQGSWREGADQYVAWANTWRHPVEPTEWMKKSTGYYLVINRQQYGDVIWPYDTLPELYQHAKDQGCDCVGLFGWYASGHDNMYPDLEVSQTMGGAEGLKAGIKAVQAEGGHVTLYYQGHLMDVNSPFYKAEGDKWEEKNIWGNPYYEFYPKGCYSDKLRHFSRKAFSTICPSVKLWHKMMAERIDWIAGFGADGALYDQIGGMAPRPCFAKNHDHVNDKPSLAYTLGRVNLMTALRNRVNTHPNFALMTEHITDVYSQFMDCLHGIFALPGGRDGRVANTPGLRKTTEGASFMPQLFRYCFPGTLITVRNKYPYMEERLTNYAFEFGYKHEVELRYDYDQTEIREGLNKERSLYARRVIELRQKYEEHLILGTFRADEGIVSANVYANVFKAADGSRVVALWNDSEASVKPEVVLESGRVTGWSTIDGDGEGMIQELPSDGVAVLKIMD